MSLLRNNRAIFASSTMGEKCFTEIFRDSRNMPGQQAQKFNRLLLSGLEKNGLEVFCVSTPPITNSNINKLFVKITSDVEKGVNYSYLPVFNVPGVKNLIYIVTSFLKSLFLGINRKCVVLCDVLNVSAALGATAAAKVLKCPIVGIVTDVPELMVTGHTRKQVELIYKIIDRCSHYVFLTEPMNERLNQSHKPYTIIEAVCDEIATADNVKHNNRSIYAGYLDEKYGIKTLVEAFIKANAPNQELHIYGNGPYAKELKTIEKNNSNIIYHGSVMNSEVVAAEKDARLLINPRPTNEEFTKYSFPSKNMEYMVSGTPVLTTKLAGMTSEYYDYIYSFDDETVDGMKETLVCVLTKSEDELIEKGRQAQKFVSEQKNNVVQTQKILDLIS